MMTTKLKSLAGFLALSIASLSTVLTVTEAKAGQAAHPGFGKARTSASVVVRPTVRKGLRARTLHGLKPTKKVTVCKESYTEFKCTSEYLY